MFFSMIDLAVWGPQANNNMRRSAVIVLIVSFYWQKSQKGNDLCEISHTCCQFESTTTTKVLSLTLRWYRHLVFFFFLRTSYKQANTHPRDFHPSSPNFLNILGSYLGKNELKVVDFQLHACGKFTTVETIASSDIFYGSEESIIMDVDKFVGTFKLFLIY